MKEESNTKVDREQVLRKTGRSEPHHADHDSAPGDATAEEIVDAIQRAKTATSVEQIWTSEMLLPGFGTPRESCGDDFPRFCTDCAAHSMWRRTCYQSMCPECAKAWARRTSMRVCAKLEAIRRYREVSLERHQRFHHAVVSPPADWDPAAEEPWKRAKDVIKEMLDAANMWGHIVYHPYKGTSGDDRGAWKERLFKEDRNWDDVRGELKFAPHFHVIAVGHEFPGGDVTRDVEAETGWVLHRITKEGTNVSIYDKFDLARAVTYCLSHAGVDVGETDDDQDEVATRWTGTKFTPSGKTANDVTASDELEREMDAVVRSVAPKTLDLDFNSLACGKAYGSEVIIPGSSAEKVDVAAADASVARGKAFIPGAGASASSTSSSSSPEPMERPAGDLPDAPGSACDVDGCDHDHGDDYLDALVDAAKENTEEERCNGRMLGLGKAPRFLNDAEWMRRAPHGEELRETYDDWTDRLEWLSPL